MEWLNRNLIKVGGKVAYHGGDGLFMWLQRSLRLDNIPLCSGKEPPRTFCWTGGQAVGYAQQKATKGFLVNATTVLASSGLVGDQTGTFSESK